MSGIGASLTRRAALTAPARVASGFDPTTIAGGQFLFDASQAAGFSDTDPFTPWVDLSGNGQDLSNPGLTAWNPTYRAAVQNGLPVARFDGSSQYTDGGGPSITCKHLILVCKYRLSAFSGYAGLVSDVPNTAVTVLIGDNGTTHFYDAGSGTTVYHLNGTSHASSDMQAPMAAFGVVSISESGGWPIALQFGRDRINGSRYWDGDLAWAAGYDHVLSTPDRQYLETGLKTMWGTP